jgi:hypothetical protein
LALQRVAKRREAIATARPFCIAVVALADDFLYCHGSLSYILDNKLRILDLHGSGTAEVVLSIPQLLQKVLDASEQYNCGRFRILYYNSSIVACLYISSGPDTVAYLIALGIQKGEVLLTERLLNTEKIFVRHNSKFLYYGTYSEENRIGHIKWSLRGYRFEDRKWFDKRIFLGCLNGCEIGATICFEIINGYFYALSNQTELL